MTSDSISLGVFPSTHWSTVLSAGQAGAEEGRRALAGLVTCYYRPLLAHLVRVRGVGRPQAEDVLHNFVRSKVLEGDLVAAADRRRGRFRTFLLTSLDRFLASEIRRERARKRRPAESVPLDEAADHLPAGDAALPADFDVAWAREVLANSARRMQAECAAAGRADIWSFFEERVLLPALEGQPGAAYEELVERFHVASPSAAYNLLLSGKRMFARCLAAVIAEYARDSTEVREEVADLRAILARAGKNPPPTAYTPEKRGHETGQAGEQAGG
jgi:RNA polymerase sigma-70 factor (ECF subfamily)